ncbi:MAG: hypothetical protein ACRDKW_05315, partial [Actinomycetota bacterium]
VEAVRSTIAATGAPEATVALIDDLVAQAASALDPAAFGGAAPVPDEAQLVLDALARLVAHGAAVDAAVP